MLLYPKNTTHVCPPPSAPSALASAKSPLQADACTTSAAAKAPDSLIPHYEIPRQYPPVPPKCKEERERRWASGASLFPSASNVLYIFLSLYSLFVYSQLREADSPLSSVFFLRGPPVLPSSPPVCPRGYCVSCFLVK